MNKDRIYYQLKLMSELCRTVGGNYIIILPTMRRIDDVISCYSEELLSDFNLNKNQRVYRNEKGSIRLTIPLMEKVGGLEVTDFWIDEEVDNYFDINLYLKSRRLGSK